MSKYTKQLRDKRAALLISQSALMSPGRSMSGTEKLEYRHLQQELEDVNSDLVNAMNDKIDSRGDVGQKVKAEGKSERNKAFSNYLRTGETHGLTAVYDTRSDGPGFSTAPNDSVVSAGATGNYGGYMVAPAFWKNLQVALRAYGGLQNDFHQIQTQTGAPMPWPTIDPTNVTASPVANELTQLSVQNLYIFGQGILQAWPYSIGPVLASLQLVNDAAFDVDSFVAARFGEALGRELATLGISGTGSGQPLGIIPALSSRGVVSQSGGYVQLGAATTVNVIGGGTQTELVGNLLSPQTILNMIASVDPAYRNDKDGNPTAAFYVSDAQLKGLREVVDSYGRPLLVQPDQGGAPILYGYPVKVDPLVPVLTATTVGGPIFGNLDVAMVTRTVTGSTAVMRLTERYADYLAVGYLGFARVDMRSNDLRAAVTVRPAAT
jgi:HK97 family phage major capsid protein